MIGSVVAAPAAGRLDLVTRGRQGRRALARRRRLRRIFAWLTLVWATTFFAKVVVNLLVYFAEGLTEDQKASILGVMRIVLGFPPYALLLALTVWAVRALSALPARPIAA